MSSISVRLPPSLNRMYRPNYGGKRGVTRTDECKEWEEELQWLWKASHQEMIPKTHDVRVAMTIYYGSHEPDIDAFFKATFDCLQGYAFENDRQIKSLEVIKAKDVGDPKLVITVTHLDS